MACESWPRSLNTSDWRFGPSKPSKNFQSAVFLWSLKLSSPKYPSPLEQQMSPSQEESWRPSEEVPKARPGKVPKMCVGNCRSETGCRGKCRKSASGLPRGPCEASWCLAAKIDSPLFAAFFDSQLPSPKLSLKMPPTLALHHKRGLFVVFQIFPRGEGNCAAIERQKLSRGNFCLAASRCLSRPSGSAPLKSAEKVLRAPRLCKRQYRRRGPEHFFRHFPRHPVSDWHFLNGTFSALFLRGLWDLLRQMAARIVTPAWRNTNSKNKFFTCNSLPKLLFWDSGYDTPNVAVPVPSPPKEGRFESVSSGTSLLIFQFWEDGLSYGFFLAWGGG